MPAFPEGLQADRERPAVAISRPGIAGLSAGSGEIVLTKLRAAGTADLITFIADGNIADEFVGGQPASDARRFRLSIDRALPGRLSFGIHWG